MKKRMKKLASLCISVSMVFSLFSMPVYASPADNVASEQTETVESTVTEDSAAESEEAQPQTTTVVENFGTYTLNTSDIDVSGVTPYSITVDENAVTDESDPITTTIEEELGDIKVLNEEGETVPLTEEQKQQILYMWKQYQDQWKDNANLLGVQLPFFLSCNDNGEDGLGVLGEMLVLAGYSVGDVRSGKYGFQELMGMIQTFYYADYYGIKYYSNDIISKRDKALNKVKNSGAKTLVQKMLVLNDWIAHEATFDMSYIMKDDDGNPIMVAEEPQQNEHYDEIYNAMYKNYEDQIRQQFHDQIYDGIVANLRQQYYEGAIKNIIYKQVLGKDESEATDEEKQAANDQAEAYMEANADAISEDAAGFVEEKFGADAAAQISAGADEFIADAKENGVALDSSKPDERTSLEDLTQNMMANEKIVDLDRDGTPETTANEAIPIYAKQAATGLTDGIIGAWEGNHIGILSEGTGVCAGYSKAFAYLLQYMSPEIYGKNGANTDMSVSENWKTAEDLYYTDGKLDITKNYLVDMVRITFDADVTMFGADSNFGEVHFWNAVQVDGKWYYVDPCYTDIYVECMNRDRVEIDGTMNHMYFMFSHKTAKEMYDGNMKEITGLYNEVSTDQSYEDSWYARIASNTYISNGNAYYMYDSTDLLSLMREMNSGDQSNMDWSSLMEEEDPEYKLVYHPLKTKDVVEGGADSDFTTLIDFNPKNEDDETLSAQVYNPKTKKMEDNELITKLYAQYKEECGIYPSIKMTTALSGNKLYFNLSNCILSYDITTGAVEIVKEYNTVSAVRDKKVALGGRAFSVVNSADGADFTFTNHPIAALTIKDDGNMYVSIATNLGFISGKDAVNDTKHYGYAYEESNYNENYSSYSSSNESGSSMESMGFSEEKNDNDEFMWSAVFVDTINMNKSCSHSSYEKVTVAPFCGRDGFTEERCTSCGAPKADSREETEDSALEHHYVHFDEQYYTKDKSGNWNTGDCYVCTVCGFAIEEPEKPSKNAQESEEDYQKRLDKYEEEKAIWENAKETAGHTYAADGAEWSTDSTSVTVSSLKCSSVCPDKKNLVDCLLADNTISITLKEKATASAEVTGYEGECTTGATAIYTANGEAEGHKFTAVNKVKLEAGQHAYEGEFTWTEEKDADGNVTAYTGATANLTCKICGNVQKDVTAEISGPEVVESTYKKEGKKIYTATATAKDASGNVLGSATDKKEVAIPTLKANSITLSETKHNLETGESFTLTATCDPVATDPSEIDWKSSDEKLATVKLTEDGKCEVTSKKAGTVIITAEAGGKSAECEVNITRTGVEYQTHVQTYGWQSWKENGETSGTSGESKRLEAIKIKLVNQKFEGSIEYRTHVQTYGWEEEWSKDGEASGTSGEAKRLEAIQIRLTGEMAEKYDVYYCVHAQYYGWLNWAKNGEISGTAGQGKRLEAIQIMLIPKGGKAPEKLGTQDRAYVHYYVGYRTHVQTYGWQDYVYDGAMSGTSGESKRLEAINIKLMNQEYDGDIEYQTHVQTYGWEPEWSKNGALSGTSGEGKRLEAIRIRLTDEMAEKYDVYYRVHAQYYGWLGWAKNGEEAGTAGFGKRLEGIEIVLVEKGGKAPGTTEGAFISNN